MAGRGGASYFPVNSDDNLHNSLIHSANGARPREPAYLDHDSTYYNHHYDHNGFRRSRASLTSSSISSRNSKPKRWISGLSFSLIVIGVAIMFLLGVLVGFCLHDYQTEMPDPEELCAKPENPLERQAGDFHDLLIYRIRNTEVKKFVR